MNVRSLLQAGFLFAIGSVAAQADTTVNVVGSDTVKPVVAAIATQFTQENPTIKFIVGSGGSSIGIKAVGQGKAQLGMASRKLKETEQKEFNDLSAHVIGRDGVSLVVNATNPVAELTKDQVQAIFTGKISNWKEVGGQDAPIHLITFNEKHGTVEVFGEYFKVETKQDGKTATFRVKGTEEFGTAKAQVTDAPVEALSSIITKPNAIGFTSINLADKLAKANGKVKLLKLDGTEPTVANVISGDYKFQRPLQVLVKGQPTPEIEKFIAFLLGPKGQATVKTLDFIPVN